MKKMLHFLIILTLPFFIAACDDSSDNGPTPSQIDGDYMYGMPVANLVVVDYDSGLNTGALLTELRSDSAVGQQVASIANFKSTVVGRWDFDTTFTYADVDINPIDNDDEEETVFYRSLSTSSNGYSLDRHYITKWDRTGFSEKVRILGTDSSNRQFLVEATLRSGWSYYYRVFTPVTVNALSDSNFTGTEHARFESDIRSFYYRNTDFLNYFRTVCEISGVGSSPLPSVYQTSNSSSSLDIEGTLPESLLHTPNGSSDGITVSNIRFNQTTTNVSLTVDTFDSADSTSRNDVGIVCP
jgi:hypothetical protein